MQRNKIFHAIAAQTILGSELKNHSYLVVKSGITYVAYLLTGCFLSL